MQLFQPYTFASGMQVRNRLVLAPMTQWSSEPNGEIRQAELDFIASHAKDAGLVITAAALVSPEGKTFVGQPEIQPQRLQGLRRLAQTIQAQGFKMHKSVNKS